MEEFKPNSYLLAKLESIQEKSLNEMNDNDLEEGMGISFLSRRYSTGDIFLNGENSSSEDNSIHAQSDIQDRRTSIARNKRMSFNEEMLSQILHEQLGKASSPNASHHNTNNSRKTTPVIVRTEHADDDDDEYEDNSKSKGINKVVKRNSLVPKQVEGLLQV